VIHYENNLRHVGRPADHNKRADTPSVTIRDYEALYLTTLLEEYAFYVAGDESRENVALAYAEYLNSCVRDEDECYVNVYVKTELARNVVTASLTVEPTDDTYRQVREQLHAAVTDIELE
jgi:hypothetical protein